MSSRENGVSHKDAMLVATKKIQLMINLLSKRFLLVKNFAHCDDCFHKYRDETNAPALHAACSTFPIMHEKGRTEKIITSAFVTLMLLPSFLMICGGIRPIPYHPWVVAYMPDGQEIITGGAQGLLGDGPHRGELIYWNAMTIQKRLTVQNSWGLRSLACSSDGNFVMIGDSAGTTKLVDNKTGNATVVLRSHSKLVNAMAVCPKNNLFVTGSFDGTIKLRDAVGMEKMLLTLPDGEVNNLAFSPDGNFLVATSRKGTAYEFALLQHGKPKMVIAGPTNAYVEAVAFAPDGQTFATGSDVNLKIWNTATCDLAYVIDDFESRISGVKFSPDGKIIATIELDGTLSVWSVLTHERINSIQAHTGRSYGIDFSPKGDRIATVGLVDCQLKIWDARTLQLIGFGTE